ncbi:hypothetical protein LZ575_01805 [Antarcticibacterium sp. 1MA-6-2]|uniref:hypothetical protein n=1 Tax=Antarcticibacterium sp. 1MA-6-2 TaxID=2908210 RepID=UPI001F2CEAB0|nr:hypothetical protein [Antarcticibacterium sp. 1MA-6-2]UJH91504.1 hypothetical protein LZ575_01805 [Antarcticibacterium sp. 1MA-6-2]
MEKIHSVNMEFTSLEFYPDYVISRVREDVLFSIQQVRDLLEECARFYKQHSFVYISLRENDYNVDPTIYYNIKNTNLAGIAIVSIKASSLKMAEFEQKFAKMPFELFTDLEEAKAWVKGFDLK